MPKFQGQFFSIVIIGKQNPQILNHDFLIDSGILPRDSEPFKTLLSQKNSQPFTEFFSNPALSMIKYNTVVLSLNPNRYQIVDNRFEDPCTSPIIQITKAFFQKTTLEASPPVGGINLNGVIEFTDEEGEHLFEATLGISRKTLVDITSTSDVKIGISFSFPWKRGIVDVQMPKLSDTPNLRVLNFNYEFKSQNEDLGTFLSNFDDVLEIYERFRELLKTLNIRS